MKKLTFVLAAALMIGLISSCKHREKCPAYGKMLQENHQQKASS